MVRYNNLPPLERALPYLVDTLYEELDSLTRLLAARPPGSLTPRDLEVIGHLIKVSSDFRACLQESAQPSSCPDRGPAEERPGGLVHVPPGPIATPSIFPTDYACDSQMVDATSYQLKTGHNPSGCQEEDRFPESGPLDPLPPRDATILPPRPALDSKDTPLVRSQSSQESRTTLTRRSTSKFQPTVSRYTTIAWRLLTKVSKIVSNRRRD